MENKEIASEIQHLSKGLEAHSNTLNSVIKLLVSLSNAVNEGLEQVNERLCILEGKQGMQGMQSVNSQLLEIKNGCIQYKRLIHINQLYLFLSTFFCIIPITIVIFILR